MSEVSTRTVGWDDGELRLDRWFRRHLPQVPHGMLLKWLRTGQVRVDGKRAEAGTRLAPGNEIRIPPVPELDPRREPPVEDDPERDAPDSPDVGVRARSVAERPLPVTGVPEAAALRPIAAAEPVVDCTLPGSPETPQPTSKVHWWWSPVLLRMSSSK